MQSIARPHSPLCTTKPTQRRAVDCLVWLGLGAAGLLLLLGACGGFLSTQAPPHVSSDLVNGTEPQRRIKPGTASESRLAAPPDTVDRLTPSEVRQSLVAEQPAEWPEIAIAPPASPGEHQLCQAESTGDAQPRQARPGLTPPAAMEAEPPGMLTTPFPVALRVPASTGPPDEGWLGSIQRVSGYEPAPAHREGSEARIATPDAIGATRAPIDFDIRPITSLTVNIGYKEGEAPTDIGRDHLVRVQAETSGAVFTRQWPIVCYQWEAPALAHRPLYFEEVNLERYGYGVRPLSAVQPVVSAGQFFATVPLLPYKMFAEPARQPVYTLGHYRPGSDVPYEMMVPPLSLSGASVEAAVVTGLIFAIP